jgi:hypothetical protein
MKIEKFLAIRTVAARQFLTCSPTTPVQAFCCGPSDQLSDDNEWQLHVYANAHPGTEAHDDLKRELRGLAVPFEIIESGRFSFIPPGGKRLEIQATVTPEIAISPDDEEEYGTLGMLVSRPADCPYLLTCNHVIAGASGVYTAAHQLIASNVQSASDQDAAIAKLNNGVPYDPKFPPIGLPTLKLPPKNPAVGMEVVQAGAKSGRVITGTIACWPCDVCVNGSVYSDVAIVQDPSFAEHGDSGSIAIEKSTGIPVGMLFACESDPVTKECSGRVLIAALPGVLSSLNVTPILTACP